MYSGGARSLLVGINPIILICFCIPQLLKLTVDLIILIVLYHDIDRCTTLTIDPSIECPTNDPSNNHEVDAEVWAV